MQYIYNENSKLQREANNEGLANSLDLASAICSMMLDTNSINEPFKPYIQFVDKRSAIPSDFTSEQLEFISNACSGVEEPLVKARFADLIWLCINPKNINFVRDAIQNYLKLPINQETWHADIIDCWKRCIQLSLQIRDSEAIKEIETTLQSAFEKDYPDSPSMHLSIAKLIHDNGLCSEQHEPIANTLFEYAVNFHASNDYDSARHYLSLAEKIFKKQNNEDRWLNCLILSAECYEQEGDSRCNDNTPSQMVANSFYENALQAYRKIPSAKRNDLGIMEKLDSIRRKITDAGVASLSEMGLVQSPGIDISQIISMAQEHVKGKGSLDLSLLFFTGFSTPNYQELRTSTIQGIKKYPLSNLFGSTHMGSDGRVIAKTPAEGLDIDGSESEQSILNKTIHDFQHHIQLTAKGNILPALSQILLEFRVTKEYLEEICYQSPIVPESREYLMASALCSGFEYDFGNAIHLLSPQVEHLVRTILKNNGVLTSNIDRSGIENENGLTTLLNHERTEEILGEDLLFELRAMFTEAIGSNFRNGVAHGLLDDQSSSSVNSVYSWWMVLRLVIRSLYEFETTNDDNE